MTLKEIDTFGDWVDGIVARNKLSSQLAFIWFAHKGITQPRELTLSETKRRGGANQDEARVLSANFGSGASMKARAVELLLPAFKMPELVAA